MTYREYIAQYADEDTIRGDYARDTLGLNLEHFTQVSDYMAAHCSDVCQEAREMHTQMGEAFAMLAPTQEPNT